MRWFRKHTSVCQNCIHGNNNKGKWIKRRFFNHDKIKGNWNIFCEIKEKHYNWRKFKRCFKDRLLVAMK